MKSTNLSDGSPLSPFPAAINIFRDVKSRARALAVSLVVVGVNIWSTASLADPELMCTTQNGMTYNPAKAFHPNHPCYPSGSSATCPERGSVCDNIALVKFANPNTSDNQDLLYSPHRGVWGSTYATTDPSITQPPAENTPQALDLATAFATNYPTNKEGKNYSAIMRARNVELDITTYGNNATTPGEPGTAFLSHYLTLGDTVNGTLNTYLVDLTEAQLKAVTNKVLRRDLLPGLTTLGQHTFSQVVPESVVDKTNSAFGLLTFFDIKARQGKLQCQTEYITSSQTTAYNTYDCKYSDPNAMDPDDPTMTVGQRAKANTDINAALQFKSLNAQKNVVIKTNFTYAQVVNNFKIYTKNFKNAGEPTDYLWQVHPSRTMTVQQSVQYIHDWMANIPRSVITWEMLVYEPNSPTNLRFCVTNYSATATQQNPYGTVTVAMETDADFPLSCKYGPYQNLFDYVSREMGNPDYFGYTQAQKQNGVVSSNRANNWALTPMSVAGTADRYPRWQYLGSDSNYQLSDQVFQLSVPTLAKQMVTGDRMETVRQIVAAKAYQKSPPNDLQCYLYIGQSNMAGRVQFEPETYPHDFDVVPGAWLFNGTAFEPARNVYKSVPTSKTAPVLHLGFNRYSNVRNNDTQQKLGPPYFMAKALAASGQATGDIGLIVNAKGATYLWMWDKDADISEYPAWFLTGKKTLYEWTAEQVAAAVNTGSCANNEIAGIFLQIGESDAQSASISNDEAKARCPNQNDCDLPWNSGDFVTQMSAFVAQVRSMKGASNAAFFIHQTPYTDPCFYRDTFSPTPPCPYANYDVPYFQYGEPERNYSLNAAFFQLAQNPQASDWRKNNKIFIVRSAGLPVIGPPPTGGNRQHYNRQGLEVLGVRMADAMIENVLGKQANLSHLFHYSHYCYTAASSNHLCAAYLDLMNPDWSDQHPKPFLVPNRGLWGFGDISDAPENSLGAFNAAAGNGSLFTVFNFTDFGISSSDPVVVSADWTPQRTVIPAPNTSFAAMSSTSGLDLLARNGARTDQRLLLADDIVNATAEGLPIIVADLRPSQTGNTDFVSYTNTLRRFFQQVFQLGKEQFIVVKTPYSPYAIRYYIESVQAEFVIDHPNWFHQVMWIPQVNSDAYYQGANANKPEYGIWPSSAKSAEEFIGLWQAEQVSVVAFEANYTTKSDGRLLPFVVWGQDFASPVTTAYKNIPQFLRFTAGRRSGVTTLDPLGPRGNPGETNNWTMPDTSQDRRGDPVFVVDPSIACSEFQMITTMRLDVWESMQRLLAQRPPSACNVLASRN